MVLRLKSIINVFCSLRPGFKIIVVLPILIIVIVLPILIIPILVPPTLEPIYRTINEPPVLDPIGPQTASLIGGLEFRATATDPDGDKLTFSLGKIPPDSGLFGATTSIEPVGLFKFDPNTAIDYEVEIIVSDGREIDSETFTITVPGVYSPGAGP